MADVSQAEVIATLTTEFVGRMVAALNHTSRQQTKQPPTARLLTVKQAATYIGRSEQALRHLIHQRDIPVVRTGRSVHIDRADLDRWIENHRC